jgi:hypothetical protein
MHFTTRGKIFLHNFLFSKSTELASELVTKKPEETLNEISDEN